MSDPAQGEASQRAIGSLQRADGYVSFPEGVSCPVRADAGTFFRNPLQHHRKGAAGRQPVMDCVLVAGNQAALEFLACVHARPLRAGSLKHIVLILIGHQPGPCLEIRAANHENGETFLPTASIDWNRSKAEKLIASNVLEHPIRVQMDAGYYSRGSILASLAVHSKIEPLEFDI